MAEFKEGDLLTFRSSLPQWFYLVKYVKDSSLGHHVVILKQCNLNARTASDVNTNHLSIPWGELYFPDKCFRDMVSYCNG